jgi:hypothetical protein
MLEVNLDRAGTDPEFLGNLFVGSAPESDRRAIFRPLS